MYINGHPFRAARQSGVSLVEAIILIVVVGAGVVGLMATMNVTVKYSADPMLRKQSIAIAESLLEEIELQPFTFCDPDDPHNLDDPPPASAAGCTGGAGGIYDQSVPFGLGETRGSPTAPFDNVADYAGWSMTGIRSIDDANTVITGLAQYNASVAVTQAGLTFSLPADAVLRIAVTVTDPSGDAITVSGYRFRYAPVATP